MDPFIGQIIPVGFNFAPIGWLLCQGQLVAIGQYEALYNLIGTQYGGDGASTFAIPNLCGRVPTHQGQATGRSAYPLGQVVGTETVTLTSQQIGQHTHPFKVSPAFATTTTPGNTTAVGPASSGTGIYIFGTSAPNTSLAPNSISTAGGSNPHENRQPFQVLNYIIAYQGEYPSQG